MVLFQRPASFWTDRVDKLKPTLQFLLLGAVAFLLIGRESPREDILISSRDLVALKETWERTNRTDAGPAVLRHILERAVYDEVLVREALHLGFHETDAVVRNRLIQNMRLASPASTAADDALFRDALSLNMHRSDVIVRRRLIARMEQFIRTHHAIDEPSESDIDAFIADNPGRFPDGERLSFCHIFLSPAKGAGDAEARGARLLQDLEGADLPAEEAYRRGDLFPHPYCFRDVSRSYVAGLFGPGFAVALAACEASVWSGPLRSGYGVHLVRLEARSVTDAEALEENRARARNLLTVEREKELLQGIVTELLARHYTVWIDDVPAGRFRLEKLLHA